MNDKFLDYECNFLIEILSKIEIFISKKRKPINQFKISYQNNSKIFENNKETLIKI